MVINTAGVTLGHGMEHPASGLKDITHGVGLAVIEPVVVEYTWSANPENLMHWYVYLTMVMVLSWGKHYV